MDLLILDVLNKWNHVKYKIEAFCVWILLLSMKFLRFIYAVG
jgi:hypothetical protein